jgi:glyoxylase-like metal-dependent hydrolase (beta-lactamase superfamily II)
MSETHSSVCGDGHRFPAGGLVYLSRATYQSTPLVVTEIRPKVFSFVGTGGTVTAVGGSQGCAAIDTGFAPRVAESYPIIDESSRGSLRGMIQAIERLLRLVTADTVVVPGHGASGNRQTLFGFRDMLRTIEDSVQSLLTSQASVAEIMDAAPTRDFDEIWGRGYVTGKIFLRMILAGLG